MPKFGFDNCIAKSSFTGFQGRQDRDPLGESERRHQQPMTNSELDKTLEEEINAMAKQAEVEEPQRGGGTKAKTYTDSPKLITSPGSPIERFRSFDFVRYDPNDHVEDTTEEHKSDREQEVTPPLRTSTPRSASPGAAAAAVSPRSASPGGAAVSPRSISPIAASPRTASPRAESPLSITPQSTCSSKPRSYTVRDRSNQSSIRRDGNDSNNDFSQATRPATLPRSEVSREPLKYKGVVVVLDEHHKIKLVESDSQLQSYMDGLPEDVSFDTPEVNRCMDIFEKNSVEKIHHYCTIAEFMKELWENKIMCDVDIVIDGEVFPAHRAILACHSEYFSDLFFKRSGNKKMPTSIRMKNCNATAFKVFLEFVYTGEIYVSAEILADLMAMSDFLAIPAIKEKCCWYLEEMPLEKAIASIKGKKLSESSDVFQLALPRITEEFTRVSECQSFFELEVATLCLILSHDALHITSEMDVFHTALKWIAHKMNERQKYVNPIMKCIRYPHMRQSELLECFEVTDLLRESREIISIILHANWIITTRLLERKDPLNCPVVQPRSCFAPETPHAKSSVFFSAQSIPEVEVQGCDSNSTEGPSHRDTHKLQYTKSGHTVRTGDILAIGGFQQFVKASDNREVKMVLRYHTVKNQYLQDVNLPDPCFHHSTALLNDKVYLAGGSDPKKSRKTAVATNEVLLLNLEDTEWTPIEPMNTPRMYHELVALYKMLYAVGGEDENGRVLNTVECYNPVTNKWFFVNPMSTARLGAGVAVFEGKIVVAGGYGESFSSSSGIPVLSSVEVFDPRSNSWTTWSDLRFPRCHSNLVNVQGILCLCGGATKSFTTNDSVLTSVSAIDVYNKKKGIWEQKSDLVIPRHFAGSAVIGGKFFIMGGVSTVANRTLSSVECYDAVNDVWINGIEDLPYPAKWLACLAIPGKI